ncbi:MAG TPA: UDP-4-amino-4,6-dideoxy-N-acetyl-beta-L-altrosamine N-acetyltransferase [Bacteroidales bacterium]|nr:UDP-4-amino-4,6-dideoxy-N-acetyl-beta-L-altrosamine N-acetyltransferase [Bacteroidales bacterium]
MEDIKLQELTEQHLELVRNWRNSIEVSQYMYTDEIISKEQQIAWFKKVSSNPSYKYWIISYNEKYLGVANLYDINKNLSSCYWAFYLGDTSIRGAGIGAKVEFNVLKYVFEELNLNKLRCEVFVFNDMVIKMHEKFGFRREAYYREHCFKNGKFQDAVGLAMLKSEWEQIKDIMKIKIYGKQ